MIEAILIASGVATASLMMLVASFMITPRQRWPR